MGPEETLGEAIGHDDDASAGEDFCGARTAVEEDKGALCMGQPGCQESARALIGCDSKGSILEALRLILMWVVAPPASLAQQRLPRTSPYKSD